LSLCLSCVYVHTCMKMHCYFLLNVKHGASQLYLGGSNYLAPALNATNINNNNINKFRIISITIAGKISIASPIVLDGSASPEEKLSLKYNQKYKVNIREKLRNQKTSVTYCSPVHQTYHRSHCHHHRPKLQEYNELS